MESKVIIPHTPLTKGGNAVKRKTEFKLDGNVVYTTKIGNTTIKICDDYVAKTPEHINQILDELHYIGWIILTNKQEKND